MCIEKAMGIEVSERVQYIRTIMDELQRIDSHLLFYSCLAMDLGALTAFFFMDSVTARRFSIFLKKLVADV